MKPSKNPFTVARTLRTALAVAVLGVPVASQAATQVYNLGLANLFNMTSNCGTGSYYNGCGATNTGWTWTDTNPGSTTTAVTIYVNIGVDCSGATRTTVLNATSAPSITPAYWCDCTVRDTAGFTLTLPASAYLPGAVNTFAITNPGTCFGSCPSASHSNYYGIVTVTYTAGSGGGGTGSCNLAPIEAKLDDRTRFTDDTERNAAVTTINTTTNTNIVNSNAAQTTTILNTLNPNIARLETKLDDGSRFTSDAERTTQTNLLVTEINANETKIDRLESKLDDETRYTDDAETAVVQQSIDALEAKADSLEAKADDSANQVTYGLQVQIEHALGEDNNVNKPMILYMLPQSVGGHLEEVRDLVDARITQANLVCQTGSARAQWTAANAQYAAGHYDSAYSGYAGAYKTASMGPCP